MGQSQSTEETHQRVSVEELSHEVALRFASKCYTHLEIAHFKDNFKTLADHQDGIEYWKEETLCRFLCLPDEVHVGSVIYQMATYLGAFPFPSLAPCILTREAMLKVVTIMTERYSKILKRGKHDKIKLLFRSMAVFDRRMSAIVTSPPEKEKPIMERLVDEQKPVGMVDEGDAVRAIRSHVAGFAIDEPADDDDEEEDDDELALAALESLDAIEVFKQDQKVDRKIHHARIPVDNFRALVMLLLIIAPLEAQDNLAYYSGGMTKKRLHDLRDTANSIIAACEPDQGYGIRYSSFTKAILSSMPYLFDPLNALFEHFLFSKSLDLSKHRGAAAPLPDDTIPVKASPIVSASAHPNQAANLLTQECLSHLSTFLSVAPASTGTKPTIFQSNARFHPLYSTTTHGTSLSSFSRQVTSWQAPTLLLVSGNPSEESVTPSEESPLPRPIIFGAFLPIPWDKPSSSFATTPSDPSAPHATLFQLSPRHAIFPSNPYNHTTPPSHFSAKTGIALGCIIPPSSRTTSSQTPILGPISLRINIDMSTATFQHDPTQGLGAFLPDPLLESAQRNHSFASFPKKLDFDIDTLEVWGVDVPDAASNAEDAATKQKKRLAWEEAEAARRRGVNFGGDKEGARALLEMAGLVGEHAAGGRSGGSV
jgi:TLD